MFRSEPSFKVYHQARAIGEIPLVSLIAAGDNILLAAKIWKIKEIDYNAKKIAVMPAVDGKKPQFFGSGGEVHARVRQEMLNILCLDIVFPELDEPAAEALRQIRKEFQSYSIQDPELERPVASKISEIIFYSFQGTPINQALQFMLNALGIESNYVEHSSSFHLKIGSDQLPDTFTNIRNQLHQAGSLLEELLKVNPALISTAKWGGLLPVHFQAEVLRQKFYDFEGLGQFLDSLKLISKHAKDI
jgi:ATP-dependent Lhr-like helicase